MIKDPQVFLKHILESIIWTEKDVPYQSLMKIYLVERVEQESRSKASR